MPAGLASLVLQAQAFFTIILGAFVFGERLQGKQLAGIALAIFGVLVLVEEPRREHVPLVGFMLTLAAALGWACGNVFQKNHVPRRPAPPIISLVVWSALIPVLPFMFASWLIDGPQLMLASLRQIDMLTVLSLLYLAFIATLVGYGIWGSLLGRYETWRVAPLSLLVPVVGMASAALLLGDAERTAARRGGADHGRALYQRFRSASGAAWHGARVKKARRRGYTQVCV